MLNRSAHLHCGMSIGLELSVPGYPAVEESRSAKLFSSGSPAAKLAAARKPFIYVCTDASPEDLNTIFSAAGVWTSRGSISSHAALLCQQLRIPCVTGSEGLSLAKRVVGFPSGAPLREGHWITVNGSRGSVRRAAADRDSALASTARGGRRSRAHRPLCAPTYCSIRRRWRNLGDPRFPFTQHTCSPVAHFEASGCSDTVRLL